MQNPTFANESLGRKHDCLNQILFKTIYKTGLTKIAVSQKKILAKVHFIESWQGNWDCFAEKADVGTAIKHMKNKSSLPIVPMLATAEGICT